MRHMCGFVWKSSRLMLLRSRHIIGFSCVLLPCQAALAETPYFSFMPAPDSTSRVIQLKPARRQRGLHSCTDRGFSKGEP